MATPTEADLRAIFAMRPEAAIEYLERKGFAITWNWHDVDAATHARALTVAKAARLDVLQDIRDALVDNLERGGTLRDFQRNLRPILEAKGWWGRQIVVAPDGGAEVAQLGSPRRLETIYQTNMQSAYMAGRYAAAYEARET
ncbi:phage head morphogenesis protein, partial [Pseudomonas aeruginosa]